MQAATCSGVDGAAGVIAAAMMPVAPPQQRPPLLLPLVVRDPDPLPEVCCHTVWYKCRSTSHPSQTT